MDASDVHIAHPALVEDAVEFRGYQVNLARVAAKQDTLVVLPTGMGKTIVAVLALADAIRDGAKRILVLAPTRPLCDQHTTSLQDLLAPPWNERIHTLTGQVAPSKRKEIYDREGILVATPQVVANDLVAGRLHLDQFDWVVFDEAHRGVGDYPYTLLGKELAGTDVRRLGLTASPGHNAEKIQEIQENLGLSCVEIRTPADSDVAPYVQETIVEWEKLPVPEHVGRVSRRLDDALARRVRDLKGHGLLKGVGRPRRKDLLELARNVQRRIHAQADVPAELYGCLSLQAQAMKLLHAIELAETQGLVAFREFLEGMRQEAQGKNASKATQSIVYDKDVSEAYELSKLDEGNHPKLERTMELVRGALQESDGPRVIVFANFRATCERLVQELRGVHQARPVLFVGQAKRGDNAGLSQKQQASVLQAFRDGEHNVLVATSVAEEGLDVPEVDMVLFFEPVASEIRSIQRRGRTGRQRKGRVIVLLYQGTQDEAAHWSAKRKEKQMVQELQSLRTQLQLPPTAAPAEKRQATLEAPAPKPRRQLGEGPRIRCDNREQAGAVVRNLHTLGCQLNMDSLAVGDYILSDRVAVERKECKDFVDSLVDGRLFEQMRSLQAYPKPLLILEGESLAGHRNVSPEALQGALASLLVDFGVPVLRTRDAMETARFLHAAAKREQQGQGRKLAVRPGAPPMDDQQRLLHIVAGLPGVSTTIGTRLLEHFGSLAELFAASEKELQEVQGVGEELAAQIHRVATLPHRSEAIRTILHKP